METTDLITYKELIKRLRIGPATFLNWNKELQLKPIIIKRQHHYTEKQYLEILTWRANRPQKKRGRRPIENLKHIFLNIRINATTNQRIEKVCSKLQKSKTNLVSEALETILSKYESAQEL